MLAELTPATTNCTCVAAPAAAAAPRRGSDLLTKVVNPEAAKPAVDLEQEALVSQLMGLLLGDQVCAGCGPRLFGLYSHAEGSSHHAHAPALGHLRTLGRQRPPPRPPMQPWPCASWGCWSGEDALVEALRHLHAFSCGFVPGQFTPPLPQLPQLPPLLLVLPRSVAAARLFPASALVMQACMNGPAASSRLVRQGAEVRATCVHAGHCPAWRTALSPPTGVLTMLPHPHSPRAPCSTNSGRAGCSSTRHHTSSRRWQAL
jgi:hypothetical protein